MLNNAIPTSIHGPTSFLITFNFNSTLFLSSLNLRIIRLFKSRVGLLKIIFLWAISMLLKNTVLVKISMQNPLGQSMGFSSCTPSFLLTSPCFYKLSYIPLRKLIERENTLNDLGLLLSLQCVLVVEGGGSGV